MKTHPELAEMDPANGWGSYEQLVETWRKFVAAAELHPDATLWCWA